MSFRDLNLGPNILKAVQEAGYTEPTPIQAQAIPQILAGHDLIGIAQTGTGKTAAFVLPILSLLSTALPGAANAARASWWSRRRANWWCRSRKMSALTRSISR